MCDSLGIHDEAVNPVRNESLRRAFVVCVLAACSLHYAQPKCQADELPTLPPPPPGALAEPGEQSIIPPLLGDPLPTVDESAILKAYSGRKYKKEVRRLNWNRNVGWNGIVPGKSTLTDAIKRFGKAKADIKGPGETQYYLVNAPVRLWVKDDKKKTIEAIEVYVSKEFAPQTPVNVRDAKVMYAPIKMVRTMEGCTIDNRLKRPGLSMDVEYDGDKARVRTLFFSK